MYANELISQIDISLLRSVSETVNTAKIQKSIDRNFTLPDIKNKKIEEVIGFYELAIVNLWGSALDLKNENIDKKYEFIQLCNYCFSLNQSLTIPTEPSSKIQFILKLFAFSYLGEKWQDMRRYIIENESVFLFEETTKWNEKLLYNIYNSIIFLIRKKTWQDLSKSIDLIKELRYQQKSYEQSYLDESSPDSKKSLAYELASLYHLAKSVEILSEYMLKGLPINILEQLDLHFEKAIKCNQHISNFEFDVLLRLLHVTFKKMVNNSIWTVSSKLSPKIAKFVETITKSEDPVFELLYPQRVAILEKGLLDVATKALVVDMPTSSGKTMIAEFKILQAINQFSEEKGWVAYVVPTKALVNQITAKLRKELGKLNITIEKMSGAREINSFEEEMVHNLIQFNVLVTTPEKLHLLVRQNIESTLNRPLSLVVIDEAHNLGGGDRGLGLEMLISTIKNDCMYASILLLTPFVPNISEIAEWLDPQNPKSINIGFGWIPNEKTIGLVYPEGNNKKINLFFKSLITSQNTVFTRKKILLVQKNQHIHPISKVQKNKGMIVALAAEKLSEKGSVLVLSSKVEDTWNIAEKVAELIPMEENVESKIELVQKYIAAELGEEFPLIRLLQRKIGVHNAGLPDEIRFLIEDLMEQDLLKVLVTTSTISQGINFPASSILIASYAYQYSHYPYRNSMPVRDFWNVVGRVGRLKHRSPGIVGIAVQNNNSKDAKKAEVYVKKSTEKIVSELVNMIEDVIKNGNLKLEQLSNIPSWSIFLQYIAHLYNQSQNLESFTSEVELRLKSTLGYNHLDSTEKTIVLNAVKEYAQKLDKKKHLSKLSDLTGFSPETIEKTISTVNHAKLDKLEWNSNLLFSKKSDTLKTLIGVMLHDMPEIKDLSIQVSGKYYSHSTISNIICDWVSGDTIADISKRYFEGTDRDQIRQCVSALYKNISNFATWGLASIQKLSVEFSDLSDSRRRHINNLPAMIYYGIGTDSGILMRMNNVPRSMSSGLGELYEKSNQSIYQSTSTDVNEWLNGLENETWDKINTKKNISGTEYKQVWKILSGIE